MKKVLLVNPQTMGIKPPKDVRYKGLFEGLTSQQPPINTGLVSIASDILAQGGDAEIVDAVSQPDFRELIAQKVQDGVGLVGIGVPSAYEHLEALEVAGIAKRANPNVTTLIGGTHASVMAERMLASIDVDAVAVGQGEPVLRDYNAGQQLESIAGIVIRNRRNPPRKIKLAEMGRLQINTFPNYLSYIPYVEDSRGCQFHCVFCTNDAVFGGKIDIRSVDSFGEDLEHVVNLYGKGQLYAVLASNFGVNVQNTLAKAQILKEFGVKWMTELRVDSPWECYLPQLYESGMTIVTSGMESANAHILTQMRKTKDPVGYIKKASQFINAVKQYPDLIYKVSYMIYPGETSETLRDTLNFINEHQDGIEVVLLTPTFIIEGSELYQMTSRPSFQQQTGFQFIRDGFWNSRGVHFGNLSREIDYDAAIMYRNSVEKGLYDGGAIERYMKAHMDRLAKGVVDVWHDRLKE